MSASDATRAVRKRLLSCGALAFALLAAAPDPGDLPRHGALGARIVPGPQGYPVVAGVEPSGPAATAGLRSGDELRLIDGRPLNVAGALNRAVHVVRTVRISVRRDNADRDVEVALAEAPRESDPMADVVYGAVPTADGRRRTVLVKPRSGAALPAVLIATGIGCAPVDVPASAYGSLAHLLAHRGYAVLRVEKSGIGDSEGAPCEQVDYNDEVGGLQAGLRWLRSQSFVDQHRVFVVGHSLGGIEAPALAAGGGVRGVVAMETVGRAWYEYVLLNARRQSRLAGDSADDTERLMRMFSVCAYRYYVSQEPRARVVKGNPDCDEQLIAPASDAYMHQLALIEPVTQWKNLDVDVLFLHGASDFISTSEDHQVLADAVNRWHPGRASELELAGVDHYLTEAPSEAASFAAAIDRSKRGPFAQAVVDTIAAWLDKRT